MEQVALFKCSGQNNVSQLCPGHNTRGVTVCSDPVIRRAGTGPDEPREGVAAPLHPHRVTSGFRWTPRPAPAGVKVVLVTFNKPQRSCGRRDSSGWSPDASVKEVILKSDEYYLMQVTSSRKPSQINPPSPRNMYFIRLHGNSLLFRRRGVCRICLRNSVPVS